MERFLIRFLEHGLRYVYPQGVLVRGLPTTHSAKPLNQIISSSEPYVYGPIQKEKLEIKQ